MDKKYGEMSIKLSILIPTYNRANFLIKNLELLKEFIHEGNFTKQIEIIVSNNNSSDDTHEIVHNFKKSNRKVNLNYFQQETNIGLEKNALFSLKVAEGEYVMYISDDDYIEFDYLKTVLSLITEKKDLGLILPSNKAIDPSGEVIDGGRDLHLSNSYHFSGFRSCLRNGWRGHQLSGVVYKREGLLESYTNNKVNNIYPFIYFACLLALQLDTYHLTKYPVKVTEVSQDKKDWGYGEDGLFNEIFDNYKKLPVNYFQKSLLQLNHVKVQTWRLNMYKSNNYWKSFFKIMFSKNSTLLFTFLFPIDIILIELNKIRRKIGW